MSRSIRLLPFAVLLPLMIGCSGTKVNTSGSMNQNVSVGLSPNLASQIEQLFQEILGRPPSGQELAAYVNELENGQNMQQLRQELATSEASIQNITTQLQQSLGSADANLVSYFAQELANGTSWMALLALL